MCAGSSGPIVLGEVCSSIALNRRQNLVAEEPSTLPHSKTLTERWVSDGCFLNRHGKVFIRSAGEWLVEEIGDCSVS